MNVVDVVIVQLERLFILSNNDREIYQDNNADLEVDCSICELYLNLNLSVSSIFWTLHWYLCYNFIYLF